MQKYIIFSVCGYGHPIKIVSLQRFFTYALQTTVSDKEKTKEKKF